MTEGGARKRDNRKQKGQAAEEAAAQYLESQGYHILARNWRCRSGEIDIIAQMGDTLIFVEVRSRSGASAYGTPAESITPRKIKQVRDTAAVYLHMNHLSNRPIQFDAVAVMLSHDLHVQSLDHIKNAF
ncbi:YraN family protein [Paenibacillus sediminis]|uniref:UPF0102 protein J2Z20_001303 n=1 Tax=Paenibacillus sediminis TaxID=664909 RepID=A0ABS4H2F6_9BACL|nr:YraN family protein [Paenibacillus sediminis]MBP1936442.1 putative endonuclease [Paenibacillus sediminis]